MEGKTQGTLGALVEPLVCKHLRTQNGNPNKNGPGSH